MYTHRFSRSWALLALFANAAAAGGQTIRGVVVDQANAPVAGVVVQLLDSASRISGRALSNERGEYRVVAPRAGAYRVSTLRIGFRPIVSETLSLLNGGEIEHRVTLSGVRVALDTMRVVGNNVCRAFSDSGAATYRVWEQVRGALTATQLTAAARVISATTVSYERTMDPGGRRVLQQSSNVRSDYVTQPWLSLSPDSLHRAGYVTTRRDNMMIYYAPGLDVLLSGLFVEDHCFRLTTNRNRLGIAFEPIPDRKDVSDIRGTMWIDRATSELQGLEYRYTNVPQEAEDRAGGDMEFARMANGTWAISRWNIRMPVVEQVIRAQQYGGIAQRVAEIRVAGGELALARRGRDTLWSRPPLVLAATVRDSTTGSTIAGASVTLAGTALNGVSDARGRVSISGVLPGQYTLEVRTPALDSVNAIHQSSLSFMDASVTAEIKVPTPQQIATTLCGNKTLDNPGMVLGSIVVRGDTTPAKGIRVFAEWDELSLRNAAGGATTEKQHHSVEARTDATGSFRFCGVPVSTALSVRPDDAAGVSTPAEVTIPPNRRFARTELSLERPTARVAMLVGVVVDTMQRPLIATEVALPQLNKFAVTDERGAFRLTDIPPGEHQLTARRVGFGALDTKLTLVGGQTTERRIILSHVVALDSVKVSASTIASFEEHRKLGLGKFLTRDDLAKQEGRHLSDVLNALGGTRIMPGRATHAWLSSSSRAPGAGNGMKQAGLAANMSVDPIDSMMGAHAAACFSTVYLDNIPVFTGKRVNATETYNQTMSDASHRVMTKPVVRYEPLFDLNSLAPEQIEAIEYYRGPSETPIKYLSSNSDCGTVVIHSRRSYKK